MGLNLELIFELLVYVLNADVTSNFHLFWLICYENSLWERTEDLLEFGQVPLHVFCFNECPLVSISKHPLRKTDNDSNKHSEENLAWLYFAQIKCCVDVIQNAPLKHNANDESFVSVWASEQGNQKDGRLWKKGDLVI